jgi:NADH-quinone oxidoreductase subunit F
MTGLADAPVAVAERGHDARTVAQWRAEIGHRFPADPSLVIPVLQYVHEAAGYLPRQAVQATAEYLRVPVSRVHGVASFYSQFHFEPRGATTISVCRGTACHVRGSGAILRELEEHLGVKAGGTTPDLSHTLETVACFGSCALAPVLVSNGRVHGRQTGATAKILVQAGSAAGLAAATRVPGTPARAPAPGVLEPAPALERLASPADLDRRIEAARGSWAGLHAGTEAVISVGTATCGLAAGAADVLEAAQRELTWLGVPARLVPVGCLGMCFAEPLVEIEAPGLPRIVYQGVTAGTIGEILEAHLIRREPPVAHALGSAGDEAVPGIPRLADLPVLRSQVRVALRNCGVIDPSSVDHYLARDGYAGLRRALAMTPEEVIAEVKASGLRGRGGAGFPTATKWEFCRAAEATPKYLICNADEGDPGAFMDRSLLEGDPHAVLEGMCIAAYAIGASRGYVYVRAEYPLAVTRLRTAIDQMRELGLLGTGILGADFSFDVELKLGAGAFVCGEETALIASIEGRRGMPRPRPPFPAVKGLFGRPSNINNVETLANVASILREGAAWYAGFGTQSSKGTKTFALTGKISRPGLIEVPMGITLGEVVRDIGGGIPRGGKFKAAQTGGPSGGCLPASMADLPIDYERLREAGSIMGSGGLVIMDEATCMVDIARYFLTFTRDESCGQCTPCREGTGRMLEILERICTGRGRMEDLPLLEELARTIGSTSLCGLGQTAPNPVVTTLRYFRDEYVEHIERKHCRAGMCPGLVVSPCAHLCPAGVEAHRYVRLVSQGNFEDAYLVVREKLPLPSVCAVACFHPCEKSCRRGDLDENIAVRALKDAAIHYGSHAEARVPASRGPRSGKSVAVVGSGPDGLSAAYYLARRGRHEVTVLEALAEPGGMLRYQMPAGGAGEPTLRKPSPIVRALERDLAIIEAAGVTILANSPVYSTYALREQGYDAIFVTAAARPGCPIEAPADGTAGGATPAEGAAEGMTVVAGPEGIEDAGNGVFVVADPAFGPASAVESIARGRAAARAIDRYLGGSGDIDEHLAPAEILSELPPLPVETGQRFRSDRKGGGARAGAEGETGYSREDAIDEASRCLRCDLRELGV